MPGCVSHADIPHLHPVILYKYTSGNFSSTYTSTMSSVTPSRALGNLEVFFKKLADLGTPLKREHWAVHLALSLRVTGDVDLSHYIEKAWQAVRRQYPAIGSLIIPAPISEIEGNSKIHTRDILTRPDFDAACWSKETFFIHDSESSADSLFCNLRPSDLATCHWLPQSSELLLRSSHWRLDGVGMVRLGHVFLVSLSEMLRLRNADILSPPISIQPPAQALPPSLEDLARSWRYQKVELQAITQEHADRLEAGADALVGEFLRGVPSIGLPARPNSDTTLPGASARVATRLNCSITKEITDARRSKGFSFTGAIHAAIVRVTARYPQHPLAKSYAAFFPVDLRQSIVAAGAASEDDLMFGLYFSGLPICVKGVAQGDSESNTAKNFDEIAREMTAVYNRDLAKFWESPDGHQVSLMELAEPYLQKTTVLFNTPTPEGLPLNQAPDLSGLGKVETYLQREYHSPLDPLAPKVEVLDMWIGTERIDRCIQFHVWSWRDELQLGASFNQSFYEPSSVANILDEIVEELLHGLGVKQ